MTVEEYNLCVDRFSDGVYRFILKSLRDKDKARDVVQDSFEKLWVNAKEVNFEKAKSYIFTTAYHTMIDLIRREKKSVSFDSISPGDFAHSDQYSDLHEILNVAIAKLPDVQKSVVILRDYEGYSYTEIAEITGLNESQVKVYIYRARMFLKTYIGSIEMLA